jgi:hypothetical protein
MQFITISTLPLEDDSDLHLHRQPSMMRESIALFKVPLIVLGLDATHEWSCGYRMPIFKEFLSNLDTNEIVLFTDSWDAFFCGAPEEMEAAFIAFDKPIVFSPETNLWPPECAEHVTHPKAPTRWQYACGGGWAGRAGVLLEMFSAPDFWPTWCSCDQAALNDWLCRHPETAGMDYFCRLFVCGYDDGKQEVPVWSVIKAVDGRIHNTETNSQPLVIHGGGGYCAEALALWNTIKGQQGHGLH